MRLNPRKGGSNSKKNKVSEKEHTMPSIVVVGYGSLFVSDFVPQFRHSGVNIPYSVATVNVTFRESRIKYPLSIYIFSLVESR